MSELNDVVSRSAILRLGMLSLGLIALASIGCTNAHVATRLRADCAYRDYGTTCAVPCDVDPDVPVTLTVRWSDPYCCTFSGPEQSFTDCRCENWTVVCSNGAPGPRFLPSSTCEFCPGTPSGSIYEWDAAIRDTRDDAGIDDASTDASGAAGADAPEQPDAGA